MSKKIHYGRWYLADATHVNWPGALPWRTRESALRGRGYASERDALGRAKEIELAYAASRGMGGPDLRAKEVEGSSLYAAYGSVRGACGHSHRTLEGAQHCADRDASSVGSLGGGAYSDRRVVRADRRPLSESEIDSLQSIYARARS